MSDDNLPQKPLTDLTDQDMAKIEKFKEEGCPGLARIDDNVLYRMTDMYLNGSTYQQIMTTMRLPRALVLYVSHTCGWYASKMEYLSDLEQSMKNRIAEAKLVNQDFLLLLTQAWQKKISRNLRRYLETDDVSHTDDIDLKEVDKLLKTIEMIKDLNNEGKNSKGKTPAVGLNLGEGVTIERSGDNKVTITPKEKVHGDILKKYADHRRAEENKAKSAKPSDITDKQEEEQK